MALGHSDGRSCSIQAWELAFGCLGLWHSCRTLGCWHLGFFGIEVWHIRAFGHWCVWALGCLGLGIGVRL